MTELLAMTNLAYIKTPHGVLSKQFRYPALRANEVNMDTLNLGNNESLVCGVFPN
ncbi:hypothetical protein FORC41_2604 [Escherichia coli]|nr:hypothetical protein FORC41_2604 [Escherichia coli]